MITTTKKIAERANQPDFKDEPCVVFPVDRVDAKDIIHISHALQTALYLLAFHGETDTDILNPLQECIDAMNVQQEQLKMKEGKIIVEL